MSRSYQAVAQSVTHRLGIWLKHKYICHIFISLWQVNVTVEAGPAKKQRQIRSRKKDTHIPVPKQGPKKSRGDIDFPELVDLEVSCDGQLWAWPQMFVQCLQANGYKLPSHRKIQLFTEFTGSTCPESTATCLARLVNVDVELVSTGDIDQQCRRLIQNNRAILSSR